MTEEDLQLAELDWSGMVRAAVARLAGLKPFVFNKDLGPSCTLSRAAATVFKLSKVDADELVTLLGYDPARRVRKPQ